MVISIEEQVKLPSIELRDLAVDVDSIVVTQRLQKSLLLAVRRTFEEEDTAITEGLLPVGNQERDGNIAHRAKASAIRAERLGIV